MIDWSCKVNVSKVTRACGHVSSTGLAAREPVYDTLTRVHEATQLGSASFHCVWVFDPIRDSNRHSSLCRNKLYHISVGAMPYVIIVLSVIMVNSHFSAFHRKSASVFTSIIKTYYFFRTKDAELNLLHTSERS